MKYSEALQYKKEALKKADESVLQNYHIIIAPADTAESARYIEEYSREPEKFKDDSCKEYSSNEDYQVVSFKKESD